MATNAATLEILRRWSVGKKPTSDELKQLLGEELAAPERAKAFGITAENGLKEIEKRSHLLLWVYPDVEQLCKNLGFKQSDQILETLWKLWLPLAMQLALARRELDRPLIQGILGGQGTGKTTLAAITRLILNHLGYSSVGVSIDDLYKTYEERKRLQQQDPRLIWRGPPGTHDVGLGIQLLDQLRQPNRKEPIVVPRFDKSAWGGAGDRTEPEIINPVDIVLFEGWFVGARPVDETAFDNSLAPIITPEDRLFAKDTNERLKNYLPLGEKLDRLIVFYPIDYRFSKQWRREAEQKMVASGKSGMSDAEIDQFVEYFWRSLHPELFITPLTKNPDLVDMVIEINADRTPGKVYKPAN